MMFFVTWTQKCDNKNGLKIQCTCWHFIRKLSIENSLTWICENMLIFRFLKCTHTVSDPSIQQSNNYNNSSFVQTLIEIIRQSDAFSPPVSVCVMSDTILLVTDHKKLTPLDGRVHAGWNKIVLDLDFLNIFFCFVNFRLKYECLSSSCQ